MSRGATCNASSTTSQFAAAHWARSMSAMAECRPAGAAHMRALLGEPGDGIGSPDGSPHRDDRASEEADEA